MTTAPITPAPPVGAADAAPAPADPDQSALFTQLATGGIAVGMMLMNSVVGDTLESINEPFGDPDDQPF